MTDSPTHNASPRTANLPWWATAVIYQIYPRSFQDTNGDGVGDLRGIQQRLPYLRNLGVDAVWISPFYRSPMADFGYDIADYTAVDPLFGTMADFDALIEAAHALNIRLIMDFVPNHTSNQHPWFIESRASRDNPRRDWYIWRDPAPDGGPPNNLVGFFGGSAWTFDETTGQYYLHLFLEEQPDLNWRNPAVHSAMRDVLRFWLNKGVNGFRLDAITTLIKAEPVRALPEPVLAYTGVDLLFNLPDIHNQPALHEVLRGFRAVLDGYPGDRVLIGETNAADFPELMGFYGDELDEIHLPQNLQTLLLPWDAAAMRQHLSDYYDALPPGAVPSLVFGNHDRSRVASRYGTANHRAAHTLLLTLWGVPTLYYGDELGMVDGRIEPHQRQDPFAGEQMNVGTGRDPERTPMQWDGTDGAGFTDGTPWLPVNTTFHSHVAEQSEDPASTLAFVKRLIALRRAHPALHAGSIRFWEHDAIMVYERRAPGDTLLVAVNFTDAPGTLDLSESEGVRVLLTSETTPPDIRDFGAVPVRAHESLVLSLR